MKTVVISQPMKGKTEEQVRAERKPVVELLNKNGYVVLDTVFPDFSEDSLKRTDVNIPLLYLARSLEIMAGCSLVYFMPGWEYSRGCIIEHKVCMDYGIPIMIPGETIFQ